jgi:hypothetical protein
MPGVFDGYKDARHRECKTALMFLNPLALIPDISPLFYRCLAVDMFL